jgi:hypothetical protein
MDCRTLEEPRVTLFKIGSLDWEIYWLLYSVEKSTVGL